MKYLSDLETMFHHRASTTNHITNESARTVFSSSTAMSWRQCFIMEHPLQITLQINQPEQCSLQVLR